MLPHGVNCTMLSAYTRDLRLDLDAQGALLQWYRERGVKSLFAMCHSTELDALTMAERLQLVRYVRDDAERAAGHGQARTPVIAAGTFSTEVEGMADEIRAVYDAGADAVVMITNRLDPRNAGEDELIRRGEALMKRVGPEVPLGLYECPAPYKRVLSCRELRWAADTGRVYFLKDTCCDPVLIEKRLELLQGKPLRLFNANAQTLLMSLRLGAWGYSSTMANVHPQLYAWLCEHYQRWPKEAEYVQQLLCFTALSETMNYPQTAKYLLRKQGVPIEINSRINPATELTPYQRVIVDQLDDLTRTVMARLPSPVERSVAG